MDYKELLELAGAKVYCYEEFGSYQGDWWAKVTYDNVTGWVTGSYGSCSGCDALQSEIGYESHNCNGNEWHNPAYDGFTEGCSVCQSVKDGLVDLGKRYLEVILTQKQALDKASENIEWDLEAEEIIKFVKKNKV